MGSLRQQVEDATIAALALDLSRTGNPATGYLRAVDPYNGELGSDAVSSDDLRRALLGRSPVVLVAAGGIDYRGLSVRRRRYEGPLRLDLILCSSHSRRRVHRQRTDVVADGDPSADPGIYQILDDVFEALTARELGVDNVGILTPLDDAQVARLPDLTVWRTSYTAKTLRIVPERDDRLPITSYAIDGNIAETDADDAPNPVVEADGNTLP